MKPNSKTGVTTYYNLLLENLKHLEISLITPADAPWHLRKLAGAYFRFFKLFTRKRMPFVIINYLRFLLRPALRSQLKNGDEILFHAQDPISSHVIYKLFKTKKIITTCHYADDPVSEFKLKYSLNDSQVNRLQKIYRKFFQSSSRFICVSHFNHRTSSFLMPTEARVSIIHNAVNFEEIKTQQTKAKNISKVIISNCGSLENYKNQVLLIDAAKQLVDAHFENFQIWLIGTGSNLDFYKERISHFKLQNHVILLGWQDAPWKLISQSHVYIHTSLTEGFGYVLIESIAAGTYTVAVNVGGVSEILEDNELIPLENAKDKICQLIMGFNFQYAEARAKEQYQGAFDKFNISSWVKKHSEIYKQHSISDLNSRTLHI